MGRYNLKPSRVYQTATQALEVGAGLKFAPLWYKTVGLIPPGEILTRVTPVHHRNERPRRRTKKLSKMFMPQPINYEEDKLRKEFYSDHPWELARPRIILEQDGKDGQKCDWSKMQQRGRQLNAESVIQRQLWLLHNVDGMTSEKAYDTARGEFYALRHEEDVERRVAREEALSTGAYFGKSVLEVGMELEDRSYELWKAWAIQQVELQEQQKNAAYTNLDTEESPKDAAALDPEIAELDATGALPA